MDELIYQFLLQAGFPRAAIVSDSTLLESGNGAPPDDASTYAIVDPETADRLAVVDVVGAIDGDALQEAAGRTTRYARRIGGRSVQGFVIRVDTRGRTEAEQVQFYRVWPNPTVQQLTAKTFPDLDGLRVTSLLALERSTPLKPEVVDFGEEEETAAEVPATRGTAGRYVPAIVLILLAAVDWYVGQSRGTGLLTIVQAVLAVGAASLLTLVAIHRGRD